MALVVQRLIDPCSKLAITQHWHTTTLAEELGVGEATEEISRGPNMWTR